MFKPALPNTGVVFVRTDLEKPVRIPVLADYIAQRDRRSALQNGTAAIETPEHCLAAVHALNIDNLIIEINAEELPGLDGSAAGYFKLLQECGIQEQDASIQEIVITEPLSVVDGDKSIYALPASEPGLSITYDMDYTQHTGVGRQVYSCELTEAFFQNNLAQARTFVLEAEALQMQAMGIGTHLGPKDILVINSDGPIKNRFRYENECVRHKIIDVIGDLKMAGRPISGRIVACKSGHSQNRQLVQKIIAWAKRDQQQAATGKPLLDIRRIHKILPHRYPFLLVDKVIEVESDVRIKGIKNVTINEHFFQGHFPGTPVMPGVLIVEALAQVSGLLFAQKLEHTGKLAVLLTMDAVKIRKSVVPGDQLILIAEADKVRSRAAKCKCIAMVGNDIVAEAELKFMLVDDEML